MSRCAHTLSSFDPCSLWPLLTARPFPSAFNVTDRDLHEAKAIADAMTLEEVKAVRRPTVTPMLCGMR